MTGHTKPWGRHMAIVLALASLLVLPTCDHGDDEAALAMRSVVPEEVLGWKLGETAATYDRETIFDYINGAGELYRAYDFRHVDVFRYVTQDERDITVELFDMGKSEDAYGVFSHAREEENTGIGLGYEYLGGLLCFWQDRYFVCVRAEEETNASKEAVRALAQAISKRLPVSGRKPELMALLPEQGMIPHSARFFHLHTSLNYHYYLASENILRLGQDTDVALVTYDPGSTYLLCIRYPSADIARQGYAGLIDHYVPELGNSGSAEIDGGKWVAVTLEREYLIVALDSPTEDDARSRVDACVAGLPQASQTEG